LVIVCMKVSDKMLGPRPFVLLTSAYYLAPVQILPILFVTVTTAVQVTAQVFMAIRVTSIIIGWGGGTTGK